MTPSAIPFMLSHFVTPTKPLLTFGTLEGFLSSVDSQVPLQMALVREFLVTLGALEWFLTSVSPFMRRQVLLGIESLCAIGATER